ncbi:MAG: nucleotidyltransferase domain-containing protein [Sulfolobales archaeon]
MCDSLSHLIERYRGVGARLVILFGSRARGDYTEYSDYDVLVVGDNIPRDPREAYAMLIDPSNPNVQPVGMNTEVFLKKLREGNTFILEALEDGRILYADEALLNNVMQEFKRIRSKYQRIGRTWVKIE